MEKAFTQPSSRGYACNAPHGNDPRSQDATPQYFHAHASQEADKQHQGERPSASVAL
jgi:hypothetical protein